MVPSHNTVVLASQETENKSGTTTECNPCAHFVREFRIDPGLDGFRGNGHKWPARRVAFWHQLLSTTDRRKQQIESAFARPISLTLSSRQSVGRCDTLKAVGLYYDENNWRRVAPLLDSESTWRRFFARSSWVLADETSTSSKSSSDGIKCSRFVLSHVLGTTIFR